MFETQGAIGRSRRVGSIHDSNAAELLARADGSALLRLQSRDADAGRDADFVTVTITTGASSVIEGEENGIDARNGTYYEYATGSLTINADGTTAQGQLTINGGEKMTPQITMLTVYPKEFTPNRDGISDRATINVVLNKPATLFTSL